MLRQPGALGSGGQVGSAQLSLPGHRFREPELTGPVSSGSKKRNIGSVSVSDADPIGLRMWIRIRPYGLQTTDVDRRSTVPLSGQPGGN